MKQLDLSRIRSRLPYSVEPAPNGDLLFKTDFGVEYAVSFEEDNNPYFKAYWFNLSNMNHKVSPGDKKIPQTVICLIEEFFRQNPYVLLYLCSNVGGQQAMRARLFMRWFNGYEQQTKYAIKATDVRGEEGRTEYVALIVQRNHPQLNEILQSFDDEIAMFNELKPQ